VHKQGRALEPSIDRKQERQQLLIKDEGEVEGMVCVVCAISYVLFRTSAASVLFIRLAFSCGFARARACVGVREWWPRKGEGGEKTQSH
jgi:hypothetical protein